MRYTKRTPMMLTLVVVLTMLAIVTILFICVVIENDGSNKIDTGLYDEYIVGNVVNDNIPYFGGWVATDVLHIKKHPSETSKTVGKLRFNSGVRYRVYDENWLIIEYNGRDSYIDSEYISDDKIQYDSYGQYYLNEMASYDVYDAPEYDGFKTFMDYRTITDQTSMQYKLQNEFAVTGKNGIRIVNGRYCVALGSYYTSEIGQYFDLILENGTVIPCILADQKDDRHTDDDNIITVHSGCLSEFIVYEPYINDDSRLYGDMSYADDNWDSPVKEVKIYDINVFN